MTASDLVRSRDRGQRTVKAAARITAAAGTLAFAVPVKASDGNLQSVLLEAGCPTAEVDKLSDRDGTTTYRANCFSSTHNVIVVTCVRGVCGHGHRSDQEPEDRDPSP